MIHGLLIIGLFLIGCMMISSDNDVDEFYDKGQSYDFSCDD